MKIQKEHLLKIVREELASYIGEVLLKEADTEVVDAHDDKKDKEKRGKADAPKPHNDPDNTVGKPKSSGDQDSGEPPVQPEPKDDPADKDLEKDDAEEPEEKDIDDVEDEDKQGLSKELEGKTVQSITQEPKSKILPGAQEIVIAFNEVPDSLHILITKTGQVKFMWKNALHNEV